MSGKTLRYTPDGSVRALKRDGAVFAPVSFFESLGAILSEDGSQISCAENIYLIYDKDGIAPMVKDGVTYLPAVRCAASLGFAAMSYCNDRLVAIATAEIMERVRDNVRVLDAASFLIFGEYPKSFTPEEFAAARKRWRETLVGNAEINDVSDPVIAEKIRSLDEKCEYNIKRMNYTPDAVNLFTNNKPELSEELCRQYDPIRDMAYAYATYGSKYYHDPELLKRIKFGLQWGYDHLYGEAEMTNTGWRDVHAFNWWYWYIGAPDAITNVLIVMDDEFTQEEKNRYLKCFLWFTTWMCIHDASALSRLVVCTKAGIILEKPEMLETEFYDYNYRLILSTSRDFNGPHVDYVDWTHYMPYNVGYGQLNLDRVLYVASKLAGTALAFRSPRSYNQFEMVKYMYEPAIHNGQAYVMHHGRNNHITELSAGTKILADMLDMIGVYGEDEDEYIRNVIRHNATSEKVINALIAHCSIYNYKLLREILDRPMPEKKYTFAYSWYTGDRVTQHRNGYSIGLALNSYREKSYESINDMNLMGWYTSDGATYLYTDYDDGQFDGVNFMFNPEVARRIPGTTEDSRIREPRSVNISTWYSPAEVAGGITVRDEYAIAGMDFVSEHYEGEDIPNISGYGGSPQVFANDLVARKAWFCLDKEIACLGTGITSTMDSEVRTTVEHRRIVNDSARDVVIFKSGKREVLPKCEYSRIETGVEYIYMDDHAGFVLDKDATVYIRRYVSEETAGQWFIEFGYVHGVNPKDEKYLYYILPHSDERAVAEYAKNKEAKTESNTSALQSMSKDSLGVRGYVFYEAGEFDGVKTDAPMLVVRSVVDGIAEYRFSEPTHKKEKAKIFISCKSPKLIDCHEKITVTRTDSGVLLVCDFDDAVGRPYFIKLRSLDQNSESVN